uniref:Uncharacterized protein n=1 Tax=Micrurus spixii TaxID=129469 RepID=A0A2D4LZJ8_9SAUR
MWEPKGQLGQRTMAGTSRGRLPGTGFPDLVGVGRKGVPHGSWKVLTAPPDGSGREGLQGLWACSVEGYKTLEGEPPPAEEAALSRSDPAQPLLSCLPRDVLCTLPFSPRLLGKLFSQPAIGNPSPYTQCLT